MSARRRWTKWRASRSRPCDRLEVHGVQVRVQQGEQVAEALVLAAVRGRGDQDQVPAGVRGQARDQLVPQHPGPAAGAVGHAGVRLVDDQQVRAAVPELLAQPGALDEVGGHHDVPVPVEQRLALQQPAFQPADRAGQHQLGVDAELGGQLPLPLLGQRRAAQHGQPGRVALLQQLGGDQAGLDGLADADVVGDQQPDRVLPQRHQQRDELVGARLDGEPGQRAERPGAGAEADPQRGAQQPGARRGARVAGVGRPNVAGLTCSRAGNTPAISSSPPPSGRSTRKPGGSDCGQHHPLAAAGLHERADLEHGKLSRGHCVTFVMCAPNTLG